VAIPNVSSPHTPCLGCFINLHDPVVRSFLQPTPGGTSGFHPSASKCLFLPRSPLRSSVSTIEGPPLLFFPLSFFSLVRATCRHRLRRLMLDFFFFLFFLSAICRKRIKSPTLVSFPKFSFVVRDLVLHEFFSPFWTRAATARPLLKIVFSSFDPFLAFRYYSLRIGYPPPPLLFFLSQPNLFGVFARRP